MTPRAGAASVQNIQPSSVPGLDLTPRENIPPPSVAASYHAPYVTDRVIVPSKYKEPPSLPYTDPVSPRREFGVQTGTMLNCTLLLKFMPISMAIAPTQEPVYRHTHFLHFPHECACGDYVAKLKFIGSLCFVKRCPRPL